MAATEQDLTVAEQEIFTARIDEEALIKVVRCYSILDLPGYATRRNYGIVLEYPVSDFLGFFFSLFSLSTPTSKKERNNIIAIATRVSSSIFHLALFRCVDVHITDIRRCRYVVMSLCRHVFMSLV